MFPACSIGLAQMVPGRAHLSATGAPGPWTGHTGVHEIVRLEIHEILASNIEEHLLMAYHTETRHARTAASCHIMSCQTLRSWPGLRCSMVVENYEAIELTLVLPLSLVKGKPP